MKRIRFIDWLKGFTIICMLFTHVMANASANPIGVWINSFHMPLFLAVGGYLYSTRALNNKQLPLFSLLKKRAVSLGIPYFVFCTALMLFYNALSYISGNTLFFRKYLFRMLTFQGIDSLWFIPCYFFSELLMSICCRSKKDTLIIGAVIFVSIGIILGNHIPKYWLFRLLLKISVSFVFYSFGYLLCKWFRGHKVSYFVAALGLILGIIGSQINGGVGIGGLLFQNPILFFANSFLTCFALFALFYYIDERTSKRKRLYNEKILSFFGKNSIVILCTNNLLIETIRLLDYKLNSNYLLTHGLLGSLIFFAIMLLLETVIILISETRIGILFGKRQRDRLAKSIAENKEV